MSDDLLALAASTDKTMHIFEGANHMSLYDGKSYVEEAVSLLSPFSREKLPARPPASRGIIDRCSRAPDGARPLSRRNDTKSVTFQNPDIARHLA